MKFKVNDYVQVSNPNRKRIYGKVARITEVDKLDHQKPYKLLIEGNTYWFEEDELVWFVDSTLTSEELNNFTLPEVIHKPKHYIGINGLEVETINRNFLPKIKDGYVSHRIGSALEYILRHPQKNGLEDLKKARENLNQIIDYLEKKGN